MSILLALTLAAGASAAAPAPSGDPAIGLWTNPKGSLTVRTRRCGAQLCATVVSASDRAKEKAARAGVDRLVGTEIFSDYRPDGGNGDWAGTLFVPDKGRRVSSTLEARGGHSVKISGCLVGRILCKSQVWTRADARLAQR